jgi:hypothetical protein
MSDRRREHTPEHTLVTKYVLRQRDGVPYEIERIVCAECKRVLEERPLRRAVALA